MRLKILHFGYSRFEVLDLGVLLLGSLGSKVSEFCRRSLDQRLGGVNYGSLR